MNDALSQQGGYHNEQEKKRLIAQRFGKAASVYDEKVQVQKQVAKQALNLVSEWVAQSNTPTLERGLDIGCGTGSDTRKLLSLCRSMTGVDISEGMIAQASQPGPHDGLQFTVADAEQLPLPENSVDLIYSSMALQWLSGPDRVAQQCARVLKHGGVGLFAVVTQDSLFELTRSWTSLGKTPQINQFLPAEQWQTALDKAGLTTQCQVRTLTTWHESVLHVMHSLKDVGAGLVLHGNHRNTLNKTRLRQLQAFYSEHFAQAGRLPLSWQIAFLQFQQR